MKRIDKNNYYLDIAEVTLERATCIRRKWGAVIVKNDEIISTGYSGAPRGRTNCIDLGYCTKNVDQNKIKSMDMDLEELAALTTANAKRLFKKIK